MKASLVIGSNKGIGLEICRQLSAKGHHVLATCRKSSVELEQIQNITIYDSVDVAHRDSLVNLPSLIGNQTLDWLVVVAGIYKTVTINPPLDRNAMIEQFEVNALGPLQAVIELLPCLKPEGAKIGLLTSRMGSIADNTSGGNYGYRMSKVALNMAGKSLAHDLLSKKIALVLLHPGWVRTEMTKGNGNISAAESAKGLIERMEELTLEKSGSFFHQNGEELPW